MSVSSFEFLFLFGISLLLYYIFPIKYRWILLLPYTVSFFYLSSTPWTLIYLLSNVIITYLTTNLIYKWKSRDNRTYASITLAVGLMGDVGILAVLKYSNFIINNVNSLLRIMGREYAFDPVEFVSPIGISFYTLISVGYLMDCYWEIVEPERNIFKTALFISYYPQLTSGPITRYSEMKEQLFEEKRFSYKNVSFGCQRILWGLFKKIVISSRAALIVDGIYADPDTYMGLYIWIASFLFMLQLYTDFSGCMDIIMGVSECYGIRLPENFRTPFFSMSVQEYWQRWHITLGSWLKDYILYPILRTKSANKFSKWFKPRFGKKAAGQITSYLGMLCVWLLIGLWHGGMWKYIVGMGLWFWLCIVLNQILQPMYKRLIAVLKIDEKLFSWHLLLSIKVFIFAAIGNMFFRLDSLDDTLRAIRSGFAQFNPWVFFDGSILGFGVTHIDINIMICGVVMLFIVGILQEKYESAREWMSKQIFVFRWFIWLTLFAVILIYGAYGPGYSASEFIYRGF